MSVPGSVSSNDFEKTVSSLF